MLTIISHAVLQEVLIDRKPLIVLDHVRKQYEWHHNGGGSSLMGAWTSVTQWGEKASHAHESELKKHITSICFSGAKAQTINSQMQW